ncbi:MAG: protoporphyrinogen oxidase [Acidimicrobiales bacterium]
MKVLVIGGGLAGLTTAYDLKNAGANVTVHEASSEWGGKIRSSPVGDRLVDAGPDNFLARVPEGIELCNELGLADRLTVPVSPKPAYLYIDGELGELPKGTVLGVPTDFDALAGIISPAGIERARQDLDLPPTPLSAGSTVADYCRARLGDEVTDTLIDPMVGGINASSIETLSMADGAAQLFSAAQTNPSLVTGLREARADIGATLGSAAQNQPVFNGLEGGMATLISALLHELASGSVTLQANSPIDTIPAGFDHVVVATEAHAAASIIRSASPTAADLIDGIRHASVAQITIEVPAGRLEPLDASGILVPRHQGFVMTACTFFSTKWAQYAAEDRYLIRITSGRFGDDRAISMSDDELRTTLLGEFAQVYADPGQPLSERIVRWPHAFPQYEPGHSQRVDAIEASLAEDAPTVHVVGNSYRGIGIPATIGMARRTAAKIIG